MGFCGSSRSRIAEYSWCGFGSIQKLDCSAQHAPLRHDEPWLGCQESRRGEQKHSGRCDCHAPIGLKNRLICGLAYPADSNFWGYWMHLILLYALSLFWIGSDSLGSSPTWWFCCMVCVCDEECLKQNSEPSLLSNQSSGFEGVKNKFKKQIAASVHFNA